MCPADADASSRFERGIHSVVQQVDEDLLELIGIGLNLHFRPHLELDLKAPFESNDAANARTDLDDPKGGRWKLGEPGIGVHETSEAVRARGNYVQAGAHVLLPVRRAFFAPEHASEILRNRLDRRERVIEFVAEHANQALPCLALFIAQRAAEVADQQDLIGQTGFPKTAAMNLPAAGLAGKRGLNDARRFSSHAIG